jgi:hypothetical protein
MPILQGNSQGGGTTNPGAQGTLEVNTNNVKTATTAPIY